MSSVQEGPLVERYAMALLNVARKRGVTSELGTETTEMLKIFGTNAPLRRFLEGPQFSAENKTRVLESTLGGQADHLLLDMVRLLIRKGRVMEIAPVLQRFHTLLDQEQGTFAAHVATAVPLDDHMRAELRACLERFTGNTLNIQYEVKPSLIGGVRFRYKDTLIDDTIAGKLDRLKTRLRAGVNQ